MPKIDIAFVNAKGAEKSKVSVYRHVSKKDKSGKQKKSRALAGSYSFGVKKPSIYLCSLERFNSDLKAVSELLTKACGFPVDQLSAQKMIMERTFDSEDYKQKEKSAK